MAQCTLVTSALAFAGGSAPARLECAVLGYFALCGPRGSGAGLAQESAGLRLYYYTVARPEAVVLAKIFYNALLLLALAIPGLLLYTLLLGNPVQDWPLYTSSIALGALSLASSLTLVSGIAARAGQGAVRCWPCWACRCWYPCFCYWLK
ncbi:hypothetical protein [Hymenobacter sp. BRD67]|uniref:hypothetical protein n=1 Tax=Hymenobacter sp. BRD67 TaxID=2675877 RepID=UPI00293BD41E|nr:hypothetical protein [Hymenobacter sp. BRD67]